MRWLGEQREDRGLGSGSRGNATILTGNTTRILIDAGLSARQMERRLDSLGIDALSIAAIVITHDHRTTPVAAASFRVDRNSDLSHPSHE